jgi:hypothetical protein
MEKLTETPLIDLAPKLFTTVKMAQQALAEWIVPDSNITDKEILNTLLGILDDRNLVSKMNEIDNKKERPDFLSFS